MKLFGTDGIRGGYGHGFFDKDGVNVFILGLSVASVLKKSSKHTPRIIIGRDTRKSSPSIESALCAGLEAGGMEAVSCGVFPTPGVAWLTRYKKFSSGAVISASHNPWQDNGIKFFSSNGEKLADEIERKIEKKWLEFSSRKNLILKKYRFKKINAKKLTLPVATETYKSEYTNYILSTLPSISRSTDNLLKKIKLVIDCSNGSASEFAAEVFQRLGAKTILINGSPDGKNINHNCGSLHPESCARAVKENKAFMGISFDGDADRVIFVDEKGAIIDGDKTIAVCATYLKSINRLPYNSVVTTVMSNLGFLEYMKTQSIKVNLTSVGDRNVWEEMKKTGAILGGEQSGHIIFKNYATTGDGLLTAVQFINAVLNNPLIKNKPLSKIVSSIFEKYPQVILNLRVKDKIPIEKIKGFSEFIQNEERKMAGKGRIFVRYSGTEPILRIMVEGPDDKTIKSAAESIKDFYLKAV